MCLPAGGVVGGVLLWVTPSPQPSPSVGRGSRATVGRAGLSARLSALLHPPLSARPPGPGTHKGRPYTDSLMPPAQAPDEGAVCCRDLGLRSDVGVAEGHPRSGPEWRRPPQPADEGPVRSLPIGDGRARPDLACVAPPLSYKGARRRRAVRRQASLGAIRRALGAARPAAAWSVDGHVASTAGARAAGHAQRFLVSARARTPAPRDRERPPQTSHTCRRRSRRVAPPFNNAQRRVTRPPRHCRARLVASRVPGAGAGASPRGERRSVDHPTPRRPPGTHATDTTR